MANPRLQAIKIDQTAIPPIVPRLLCCKIDQGGIVMLYPRMLGLRVDNNSPTIVDVLYAGVFYKGNLK